MPWVRPLASLSAADAASFGNKAANLGELTDLGCQVPPGFAISADVFRDHFEDLGLGQEPQRPELSHALLEHIWPLFDSLVSRDPSGRRYVAVRSSALGEDGTSFSYAGQHATYYYITREHLADAIVNCWMSLWSEHAQSYREATQARLQNPEMAVIVQQMVNAESSGVAFSEDPTGTLPQHTLIESTWGLGAALVDGRVTPDQYFVNQTNSPTITRSRVGSKQVYVPADLRDHQHQRLETLPNHKQASPSLTTTQVFQVSKACEQIAEHMGGPQDVEWAIEGESLFILQTRPITALSQATPELAGRWILFKPLAENFTEPLTPLSEDIFGRLLPNAGRFIQGRYYINFDRLKTLLPLKGSETEVAQALLLQGGRIDARHLSWFKLPLTLASIGLGYLCMGMFWHRATTLPAAEVDQFSERLQTLTHSDIDPLRTLQAAMQGMRPFEPIYNYPFLLNIASGRYFVLQGLLRAVLNYWAPQAPSSLVDRLCMGYAGMASRELLDEISALAQLVREDSELVALEDRKLIETLLTLPVEHPFSAALRRFLREFGHRAAKEMELATPRWREAPEVVLQSLLPLIRSESNRPDAELAYRDAQATLKETLNGGWRYRLVNFIVHRCRHYLTQRENTRQQTAAVLTLVREKLNAVERQLVHDGHLHCAGDLYFLTWHEISLLCSGAMQWRDIEALIRQRRQRHLLRSRSKPPMTVNLNVEPPTLNAENDAENTILGQCASPGYAEGIARVVMDPANSNLAIKPNDILIAPYTDPGWTPLFLSVAAVVVETGSYLSHAGTVAREYRVPCVVDAHNCTDRIPDGATVRVFADTGVVEVVTA